MFKPRQTWIENVVGLLSLTFFLPLFFECNSLNCPKEDNVAFFQSVIVKRVSATQSIVCSNSVAQMFEWTRQVQQHIHYTVNEENKLEISDQIAWKSHWKRYNIYFFPLNLTWVDEAQHRWSWEHMHISKLWLLLQNKRPLYFVCPRPNLRNVCGFATSNTSTAHFSAQRYQRCMKGVKDICQHIENLGFKTWI